MLLVEMLDACDLLYVRWFYAKDIEYWLIERTVKNNSVDFIV